MIFVLVTWLLFIWPTLKVELEGSMVYRQSDFREYYLLTPDLLKEMPRISDDYFFAFANVSGQVIFISTVTFENTTVTSDIKKYLRSRGWVEQKNCHLEAKCWQKNGNREVLSVVTNTRENYVRVQIADSPNLDTYYAKNPE